MKTQEPISAIVAAVAGDRLFFDIEALDQLYDRSFFRWRHLEKLQKIDWALQRGLIESDEYFEQLLTVRLQRQSECDIVAAELLATVNLGD